VPDGTLSQGRPPIDLDLNPEAVAAMRLDLAEVAGKTVAVIRQEVPSYADPFRGEMGRTIEHAVQLALDGFLGIASGDTVAGAKSFERVSEAAYALGRGEARAGRSMDALLSAYRVGARVAWRDMSQAGVHAGLPAETVAHFAELVFAYIDELSASSAAGHADELATSGRVRQRYLERLTQGLLRGASADALEAAAERADWKPPPTLAAVVLPDEQARHALAQVDNGTLQPTEQVPGLEDRPDLTVLLVPVGGGRSRTGLLRRLEDSNAVVGPARPWHEVGPRNRPPRATVIAASSAHSAAISTRPASARCSMKCPIPVAPRHQSGGVASVPSVSGQAAPLPSASAGSACASTHRPPAAAASAKR